jgi:hypothetical protein
VIDGPFILGRDVFFNFMLLSHLFFWVLVLVVIYMCNDDQSAYTRVLLALQFSVISFITCYYMYIFFPSVPFIVCIWQFYHIVRALAVLALAQTEYTVWCRMKQAASEWPKEPMILMQLLDHSCEAHWPIAYMCV